MTNIYRPSTTGGGRTVEMGGTPSSYNSSLGNPYNNQDPLATLQEMINRRPGAGNTQGGSVGWERYGDSRYEDQAARELRNDASPDAILNQELVMKYAIAAQDFYRSLIARKDRFYQEYRAVLENFRLSKRSGIACPIRSEFVDTINMHPEIIFPIAAAAVPIYGQLLVESCRSNGNGEVSMAQYIQSIQMAVRMVLTMEMISWLCKSRQGRQRALFLTPELKSMVGGVEQFKDTFNTACTTFSMTNPYAGLVYEVHQPIRADSSMIAEAELAFRGSPIFGNQTTPVTQGYSNNGLSGFEAVDMLVSRAAHESRAARSNVPAPAPYQDGFGSVDWATPVQDLSAITTSNKDRFDYKRSFKLIKDDYYVIPEADWKKVKGLFKRHPDQPIKEDSVLPGCFRVVKIDLENDDGWFSMVIRSEGLDMLTGLTNPRELLPALEEAAGSNQAVVSQIAVEDILDKRKTKHPEVKIEACEKLEGIPLITVKEQIVTNMSKNLTVAVSTTNDTLTKDLKNVNATSFNTLIWETFTCESEEEKERMVRNLPFLFKDQEEVKGSFFARVKKVSDYVDAAQIGDELAEFIDQELTFIVNDWLVNTLMYDNTKEGENHLSVSSILNDYIDLNDVLRENDEEGWTRFNADGSPANLLTEKMKLFTLENKHIKAGTGLIKNVVDKLDIVLERPIHFTVINNRYSPSNIDNPANEALLIRRSKFPEFFKLVEDGFEPTMGDELNFTVTDKVIRFDQDNSMWLFSYSSLDVNVATLRRVSTRKSLLFLRLQ